MVVYKQVFKNERPFNFWVAFVLQLLWFLVIDIPRRLYARYLKVPNNNWHVAAETVRSPTSGVLMTGTAGPRN